MFSANAATAPSTPVAPRHLRGRRRATPGQGQAFTLSRPGGWTSDLNQAILALVTAGFVAPQLFLYPPAAVALFGGTYIVAGIAARNMHRKTNAARLRRWVSERQGIHLTTADAQALINGGATATHEAALSGDQLHLTPLMHQAEPIVSDEPTAADAPLVMSPAALAQ